MKSGYTKNPRAVVLGSERMSTVWAIARRACANKWTQFWVALIVTWLFTNLLTWDFQSSDGGLLGTMPFLIVGGLALAVKQKGFKSTLFVTMPLLFVIVVAEVGVHLYFYYFATRDQKLLLAGS